MGNVSPQSTVYYNFLRGQWLLCNPTVDENYIEAMVAKGKLTREEADAIYATPRNCE